MCSYVKFMYVLTIVDTCYSTPHISLPITPTSDGEAPNSLALCVNKGKKQLTATKSCFKNKIKNISLLNLLKKHW